MIIKIKLTNFIDRLYITNKKITIIKDWVF